MQEIMNAIKKRRSIRSYENTPVPTEALHLMLEAGGLAPSGKNGQPWRFSVIQENARLKDEIADLSAYRRWVKEAPCLIAVWLDTKSSYDVSKDLMGIGACIENILLMAEAQNLGTCWLGEILKAEETIKALLNIPADFTLTAVLTVGYIKTAGTQPARRSVKENLIASDRLSSIEEGEN